MGLVMDESFNLLESIRDGTFFSQYGDQYEIMAQSSNYASLTYNSKPKQESTNWIQSRFSERRRHEFQNLQKCPKIAFQKCK